MAIAQNKKWALDTNVIFDLARDLDTAHSLREIAAERIYSTHIAPTTLDEIVHKSMHGAPTEKTLANLALNKLAVWDISILDLAPGLDMVAEKFSQFLREHGVLPFAEINDGLILAESSLGGAALLISSDPHLASIDPDHLRLLFDERDLHPIPVITPMKLLRLLESKGKSAAKY